MTVLTPRFDGALLYTHEIHAGIMRRGVPMIGHLLTVTGLVIELGGSEDEAIAALLHDAAEDAGGRERLADIEHRFGAEVARMVDECTDTYDQSLDWRQKKEQYLERIPTIGSGSLLVSAADKLSNVRQLCVDVRERGEAAWPDYSGGQEGRVWYYRALAEAFAATGGTAVQEEFRRAVHEMEKLAGGSTS